MKQKELKNLAKKIAQFEKIIQATDDANEKKRAENEIMKLSNGVKSLEDMIIIDELIQDILENS